MPRGRKPGSKNKATLMKSNTDVVVKKVITKKEPDLRDIANKKGKAPARNMVLQITPWLYIAPDPHCWIVREVREDGRDRALLYYPDLRDAIMGVARRMVRVPGDVAELGKKMDDIYSLIDARVPVGIKPKDLFTFEIKQTEDVDDE